MGAIYKAEIRTETLMVSTYQRTLRFQADSYRLYPGGCHTEWRVIVLPQKETPQQIIMGRSLQVQYETYYSSGSVEAV